MKLHPFNQCAAAAYALIQAGHHIYQQFNCAHCGSKQTMDEPDKFYMRGICEKCGKETNIKHDGCNYMVHAILR